jgi:hypothetical protein
MASPGFFELTEKAIKAVKARYPLALFLEADGVSPTGKAAELTEITNWRFVFMTEEDYGTIYITSGEDGKLGELRYVPESWVDDHPIPWPVKMELAEAFESIRSAGYENRFLGVSLRWPLYPGIDEPHYIFELDDERYVFVGVNSKVVQVHK